MFLERACWCSIEGFCLYIPKRHQSTDSFTILAFQSCASHITSILASENELLITPLSNFCSAFALTFSNVTDPISQFGVPSRFPIPYWTDFDVCICTCYLLSARHKLESPGN